MAACLWAGSDAVISHATAGVLWALDGIATRRVEITVPERRGLRSNLVTVHRSLIDLTAERCDIEGIAVTSATRTLLDLAGALPQRTLELAMEDAFRRGLSSPSRLERLFAEAERDRRAGAPRLRALLESRSGRANTGSGGEVLLERLLRRCSLPTPTRQHPVVHDGRKIHVDFAYPELRLAIEFDSLRWHTGRGKLDNDADRRNLLRAAKWDLVIVTYTMVKHRAAETASLICDAYADCRARTAEMRTDPHNSRG
jgi:very-short-patch-repair endonuclease